MTDREVEASDESHRSQNINWLRAAVLGANDGIVSTASLIAGVAAGGSSHHAIVMTGAAGLAAGAMSMAAGEYVSVSSQADTEAADLKRERRELASDPEYEHHELAQIYVKRGLEAGLAKQVARQLMAHDALGSHARDELGITQVRRARPRQAALASAAAFSLGGAIPVASAVLWPHSNLIPAVAIAALVFLAIMGAVAARVGGANLIRGAARVVFWGAFAMAVTAGIGALFRAV